MNTIKVSVRIPAHVTKRGKPCKYGDGEQYTTITLLNHKEYFKCPRCGTEFPIVEDINKKQTPECVVSDGVYTCSITQKELDFDRVRAEIICNNEGCTENCAIGCHGGIFEDVVVQAAFKKGFYNESGLVNQGTQHSKGHHSRMNSIPLTMLDSLGLQGFKISKDPLKIRGVIEGALKLEELMEFTFDGTLRKPRYLGSNLYDIQDEQFYLFHVHQRLIEYKENEVQKAQKDDKPSHVGALVEKATMRMFALPKANKNMFGFNFKGGTLYAYFPQKGNNLADGDAFKDNSRFVAYKTKDFFENPKINKREKIYGYLTEDSKKKEFLALTKRPTRIISSDDYSGVPRYSKYLLWELINKKTYKSLLEVIEEDNLPAQYAELAELTDYHPTIENSDITDFNDIDIEEVIENILVDEDDAEKIRSYYKSISGFIDEFCDGIYGSTGETLRDLYRDVTDPDYINFKRFIDKFRNGDSEQNEYHDYSNYDLIQACKYDHIWKIVTTMSKENRQAINELKARGTLQGEDRRKDGKAQEVAFEYIAEYTNLDHLIEEKGFDVQSEKLWALKPREEWSEKDLERHLRGAEVKEVVKIVAGANVNKDKDSITRHLLYNEPLPEKLSKKAIVVSGSRVMSGALRTYMDEDGYYITPAVNVWKGYYIKNKIRLVFARCAKGSDCAAIIAALEINEYLYKLYEAGKLTEQQYAESYIIIVIVGHSWYKSIDFNNPGLSAIIELALKYKGYFVCNEPYRQKRGTETIISNVEYFDEREDRLKILQTYDRKEESFKTLTNKRFHRFDRKIERANKYLVSLGGPDTKLVILCRSEYSGTTNTMNFALEAGKEVVEITSPSREAPRDFRGENDPIQKGHSDLKYYQESWDITLAIVPSTIKNYHKWYQVINQPGRYRLGANARDVPSISITKFNAPPKIEVRKVQFERKPRYRKTMIEQNTKEDIRGKSNTSNVQTHNVLPNTCVIATVPSVINNYAKWYRTIDAIKSSFVWIGNKECKTYGTIIKRNIPQKKTLSIKSREKISSQKRSKALTKDDLIRIRPSLKKTYQKWEDMHNGIYTENKRSA